MSKETVGGHIRAERHRRRLFAAEVAEWSGIGLGTLLRAENNIGEPRFSTICRIAKILDLDMRRLQKLEMERIREQERSE